MASIQVLVNQVIDKVRTAEEAKLEEAKRIQASELANEKEKIEHHEATEKEAIQQRVNAEMQRKQQSYINELRNQRLQEKQNLLSGVYSQAIEGLSDLPAVEFAVLIRNALKQLNNNEPTQLVIGEKSQKQLDENSLQTIKNEFPQVSLSDDMLKNEGGFILSQQGMDYNFTYSKLIEENKDALASELSRMAF